jgi:hypothetical protein
VFGHEHRPASGAPQGDPRAGSRVVVRVQRHLPRVSLGIRIATRAAPASKTKRETREIVTRHKMDELRTSWGGVFPPMHRAVIEDGEHKRKREDEHDPSIREGAEGEYGSPQDRALAQRRRRFSKSRAR